MILDRHVLGRFLSTLLLCLFAITIIFVVVDYVGALRIWAERTPQEIRSYYIYAVPYILYLVSPIALLLSSMFTVAGMARRLELSAMLSAGRPFWRIVLPIWLLGAGYAAAWVHLNEEILPRANHERVRIRAPRNQARTFEENTGTRNEFAYMADGRSPFFFHSYSPERRQGWDVTWCRPESAGRFAERIDAENARWDSLYGGWVLTGALVRKYDSAGKLLVYGKRDTVRLPQRGMKPEELISSKSLPDEMTLEEILARIESLRRAGEPTTAYEAEANFKKTSPWINGVVVLIGTCLAGLLGRRGTALSFGLGILVAFACYAGLRVELALGHAGTVEASMVGWWTTGGFSLLGLGLLWRVSRN